MKVLYVAKSFGRTHFFKTPAARDEWIVTLPDWEQKHVASWEVSVRSVK